MALLLSVFGFFFIFDVSVARLAVDRVIGWFPHEDVFDRLARLLAWGSGVCAAGFVTTWWLTAWLDRRRPW